jgi:hypothetical protein
MIAVRIGNEERHCPVDPNWINKQIKGRKDDGSSPCVRVTIKTPDVDVALSTKGCSGGGGGGRQPNARERDIFTLWTKHHLDHGEITGGNLVSFLKQLGCA